MIAAAGLGISAAGPLGPGSAFLPEAEAQAPAVSTTVRPGRWSDPGTWDTPPTRDRRVRILHDLVIDGGEAGRIDALAGTTTLAGTLHAYGSFVVNGADLHGTEGQLLFHVPDDRLFTGNTGKGTEIPGLGDFLPDDTGLWVLPGSCIHLNGAPVTSWLNAIPKSPTGTALGARALGYASIGNGEANLAYAPTGWRTGDRIALTSPRGGYRVAELHSVSGNRITYAEIKSNPTDPDFTADSIQVDERWVHPKVANLSRRVVIASADVTEAQPFHRAHTIYMHGACVDIHNTEFRNLGARAKLGRYPVHLHHTRQGHHDDDGGHDDHACGPSNVCVMGSSIWQDVTDAGSRFIAIHNTQGACVTNNVGLRSQGHGFFMEDGREVGNHVVGNLSIDVRGPEELPVFQGGVNGINSAHHFWLRADNVVEGNAAVGVPSSDFAGKDPRIVHPAPVGLVILPHTTGPIVSNECTDNEFHGMEGYSAWGAVLGTRFVRLVSAYAGIAAYTPVSAWNFFSPLSTLEDPTLLFSGEKSVAYGSHLYLNYATGITVTGGVLAGRTGLQAHYAVAGFRMDGTRVYGGALLHPTYWDFAGTFTNVQVDLTRLFEGIYQFPNRCAPGLARFSNVTGRVNGVAATLDGDYTHPFNTLFPGLEGVSVGNGVKLTARAPVTGFIRIPYLVQGMLWVVLPVGKGDVRTATLYPIREDEASWRQLSPGYLHGFPPGDYDVRVDFPDGGSDTRRLRVTAGAITTFDLNWAPKVQSLVVSPGSVAGGTPATGTVTLSLAAPAGGVAVTLTSSDAAARLPASVTVSAGATSAFFTVSTSAVANAVHAALTASAGGESATATLTVEAPPPPPPPPGEGLRINAGGGEYVSATLGAFQADSHFNGGTSYLCPTPISGTSDPSLYQTMRYAQVLTYNLPAAAGTYTLKLHFAEPYWWQAGARTFNVKVNGTSVLQNFDIWAAAGGGFKAVVKSFPVTSPGPVAVTLEGVVGQPVISALELVGSGAGGGGGTPPPPPPAAEALRINAGGGQYVSATLGTFQADSHFSGGTSYLCPTPIRGTSDPSLYQTMRYAPVLTYSLPAAPGAYALKLHFAEPYWWYAGARTFNVKVNGTTVLPNFDIWAAAGDGFKAVVRSFPVTSAGTVTVTLEGVVGQPVISALELVPAG